MFYIKKRNQYFNERNEKLKETFDKEVDGKKCKIQRYCPHALGDLSKGYIKDNYIVCPIHGWEFSLKDGKCNTNESAIKIESYNE